MSLKIPSLLSGFVILFSCGDKPSAVTHADHVDTTVAVYGPYACIKLPVTKGIGIQNPIMIALGPDDKLYASNATGEVYTLLDTDGDGLEDEARLYVDVKKLGLRSPSGFAHRGDTIYIGTAQQVRAFIDRDRNNEPDTSWVFFDDIPNSEHPYEWTCGLSFGEDGWLYLALSTDSWNAAPSPDPGKYRGSILRISPDGKTVETVATGIRSVYGMRFDRNGELFFIDNEGGGNPTEELNRLVKNSFYGHNPNKFTFDSARGPEYSLTTEMAPSGLVFNNPDNDFGGTGGDLFISFYGPGERWSRGGVARLRLQRVHDGTYSYEESTVADIPKLSNLAFGKDGSLYLSQHGMADYWYNAVYEDQGNFYKLVYDPSLKDRPAKARPVLTGALSQNAIEAGKQLFAERACLGCHAVDGETELLGPNLRDIGTRMSREEILEEILQPSERIKPSMGAIRVTKKDGQVFIGRVVSASEKELSIMLVGNHVVQVQRADIAKDEEVKTSLMYEGLLNGLSEEERASLLDYMVSLSRTSP